MTPLTPPLGRPSGFLYPKSHVHLSALSTVPLDIAKSERLFITQPVHVSLGPSSMLHTALSPILAGTRENAIGLLPSSKSIRSVTKLGWDRCEPALDGLLDKEMQDKDPWLDV